MKETELWQALAATGDNLYDFAWLDETGSCFHRFQPCANCHNGYSVAKLFIATAVGLLWADGKLSLDDPVERFFPTNTRWRQVLIRHLLTHTSGIAEGFLDIDNDDLSRYPSDDYLSIVFAQPLPFAPGTHEQYSDAVFYLLARIVEQVQGQPADDFLADRLFRPMGFGETAWSCCPQHQPIGGTGFYAGAQDVAKLGALYLNGGVYQGRRLLSEKWVQTALQNQYELHPLGHGDWIGKLGMCGQGVAFSPQRKAAAAWHAFDTEGKTELLLRVLGELPENTVLTKTL